MTRTPVDHNSDFYKKCEKLDKIIMGVLDISGSPSVDASVLVAVLTRFIHSQEDPDATLKVIIEQLIESFEFTKASRSDSRPQ